jgi:hypothetical protein
MKTVVSIFFVLLVCTHTAAQTDAFSGIWQMDSSAAAPAYIHVKIGTPEKGSLYPAAITIQSGTFYGVYELLLVKKNTWQLAISKNKYAAAEKPFHLDMLPLNGSFDLGRNTKGQPQLLINRLPLKLSTSLPHDSTAVMLQKLVNTGAMQFIRTSLTPWKDAYTNKILNPSLSPVYFGLVDTAYVSSRYGSFYASTSNKTEITSAVYNGRPLFEEWLLTKKERSEEIMIDTGSNILAFFADYAINSPLSKAAVRFEFDKHKFYLDFKNSDDSGASFIAAKVSVLQDKEKLNAFVPYTYPGPGEPPLQNNERLLGSIKSTTKELTLAIWDDAVEDGDTISISVNGNWVAKNALIRKVPQFIHVTLNPGSNTILFVGENLGSIPPNTSVLEIIDGKRRKAFFLETVTGENNLLKIFYDNGGK